MRKISGIALRMRINGPTAKQREEMRRRDEALDDELGDPRRKAQTAPTDCRLYPLIEDDQ